MSYEGFELYICENGHAWQEDAYSIYEDEHACPDCNSTKVAYQKGFDCTNGCGACKQEYGENYKCGTNVLEVNTPAEHSTCECCGHTRETKPITYKIPGK